MEESGFLGEAVATLASRIGPYGYQMHRDGRNEGRPHIEVASYGPKHAVS